MKEQLPRWRAGINALRQRLQMNTPLPQIIRELKQVSVHLWCKRSYRSSQPIELQNNQGISLSQKLQRSGQLQPIGLRPTGHFRENAFASGASAAYPRQPLSARPTDWPRSDPVSKLVHIRSSWGIDFDTNYGTNIHSYFKVFRPVAKPSQNRPFLGLERRARKNNIIWIYKITGRIAQPLLVGLTTTIQHNARKITILQG
jgi:hypothetical protein